MRSNHSVWVGAPLLASLAPNHVEEAALSAMSLWERQCALYCDAAIPFIGNDCNDLGEGPVCPHLSLA